MCRGGMGTGLLDNVCVCVSERGLEEEMTERLSN